MIVIFNFKDFIAIELVVYARMCSKCVDKTSAIKYAKN